jgi:predicted RNase H-like HicB family nuclease
MIRYEVIIYWSDEDGAFVAEVPELAGCSAHGTDYESALANAREAIDLWLATAREFGDPIPEPKGRRLAFA